MRSKPNRVGLRERLMENLERLSEDDIQEILDFVEFLLTKRNKEKITFQKTVIEPEKDPILKLMGLADVEPFAHRIDQELYG